MCRAASRSPSASSSVRPDIKVLFGGISSTYYANELIRYPFIDIVMRGYDTLEPMDELLAAIKAGRSPEGIANLLWKDASGDVRDNDFSHNPRTYGCGIDWAQQPKEADVQRIDPDPRDSFDAERGMRLQLRMVRRLARGVPADLQAEPDDGEEAARPDQLRIRDDPQDTRASRTTTSIPSARTTNPPPACTISWTRWARRISSRSATSSSS